MRLPHRLCLLAALSGGLLFVSACKVTSSQSPAQTFDFAQWEGEMRSFAKQDSLTPPPTAPIVFTGSSSVRMWQTLAQDFPAYPVLNRGFGGSRFPDANYYFNQLVLGYQPKQVVLYEGDNDIQAGSTPEEVYKAFQEFESRMRRDLPQTELVFIAIKPCPSRWALYPQMQQANAKIKAYIDKHPANLKFVDFGPAMLGANGKPRPELYLADSLHMTPAGYAIWTQQLKPYLRK